MKKGIIFLVLVSALFLSACQSGHNYDDFLTGETCDLDGACSEGYTCGEIDHITEGPECISEDPCSWLCEDQNCFIAESYPPEYGCY